MANYGCCECGRRGGTLFRFTPGQYCSMPPLVVCAGCANATDGGPYAYCCKTVAKAEYKLRDDELDALRVAFTENPYDYG